MATMGPICTFGAAGLAQISPSARASAIPAASSKERPADSFKPVQREPETASGALLLVEAYAAIWLMAFVLILFTIRKQRSLDTRISRLQRDLAKAGAGDSDAPGGGKVDHQEE